MQIHRYVVDGKEPRLSRQKSGCNKEGLTSTIQPLQLAIEDIATPCYKTLTDSHLSRNQQRTTS